MGTAWMVEWSLLLPDGKTCWLPRNKVLLLKKCNCSNFQIFRKQRECLYIAFAVLHQYLVVKRYACKKAVQTIPLPTWTLVLGACKGSASVGVCPLLSPWVPKETLCLFPNRIPLQQRVRSACDLKICFFGILLFSSKHTICQGKCCKKSVWENLTGDWGANKKQR